MRMVLITVAVGLLSGCGLSGGPDLGYPITLEVRTDEAQYRVGEAITGRVTNTSSDRVNVLHRCVPVTERRDGSSWVRIDMPAGECPTGEADVFPLREGDGYRFRVSGDALQGLPGGAYRFVFQATHGYGRSDPVGGWEESPSNVFAISVE